LLKNSKGVTKVKVNKHNVTSMCSCLLSVESLSLMGSTNCGNVSHQEKHIRSKCLIVYTTYGLLDVKSNLKLLRNRQMDVIYTCTIRQKRAT